jgi:ElaB/YqjD/DUF883 family membrane-anchored ribosome-binding protein
MNDIKDKVAEAATDLGKGVRGVAEDMRTRTKHAWDSVQHGTQHAAHESVAYARKNPLPTALVAFGCGLVLGLFIKQCDSASSKDRSTSECESRGLLIGLLITCGALLKRTLSTASSKVRQAGEKLGA